MELDRHFIERNDFSATRRGYDPDEVDRHLREIAEAVTELKRSQRRSPSSLASTAADQVRGIVEAAERSAADIQEQAETEAKRIVDDATARSRETREKADADAAERVSRAEQASERMLERTSGVEAEVDRLLGEMRSAAGNLVENLRNGASSLSQELTQIRGEFEGVREGRLEPPSEGGGESAVHAVEPGPVDAEPPVIAEMDQAAAADAPAEEEELGVEHDHASPEAAEPHGEAESGSSGRSIRGAEGARLIALNMALNGTPRDETARYLAQNFELADQDSLLDEVYARVGG
ncbi:MAG: hypothetical protein NVSMB25_01530 [Thermoleophilaceae bacterium]